MKRSLLVTSVALGAVLAAAGPAEAQRYGYGYRVGVVAEPYGWYGGIGLLGTRIVRQDGGPELLKSGAGMDIYAGVRLNERLSLELGFMESFHNPTRVNTYYGSDVDYLVLSGWTFDARIHFDSETNVAPYVQGGLGLYALSSTFFGTDSIGSGFQLGGGVDFFVGEFVTVGVRLLYRGIAMGPPDSSANDTFISALTLEGSLGIHF